MSEHVGESNLQVRVVVRHPPPGVSFAVQKGRSGLVPPVEIHKDQIVFGFVVRLGKSTQGAKPNFLGPFAQGPRAARFVYLNAGRHAGQPDSCWDRRAKIPLGGLTWSIVKSALATRGAVEARVDAVGRDGGPACGSVDVFWRVTPTAGPAHT